MKKCRTIQEKQTALNKFVIKELSERGLVSKETLENVDTNLRGEEFYQGLVLACSKENFSDRKIRNLKDEIIDKFNTLEDVAEVKKEETKTVKKLEKTSISKSYKGVRCIQNTSIQKHLTLGKVYEVFGEDRKNYHVVDDKHKLEAFSKEKFVDVEKTFRIIQQDESMLEIGAFEEVLKLEYKEVWDKVAFRIVRQDEKIFERGAFEDVELKVRSLSYPDFSKNSGLLIRGKETRSDNKINLVTIEQSKTIKEIVLKVNKKYGKVKSDEEIITSYPTKEYKKGEYNHYLIMHDNGNYDLTFHCTSKTLGTKYFKEEDIEKMVEELNKRRK